jgi:hypothetical protein
MSDRPQKLIVDCSTGEQTYVPLTDAEIEERELMAAQAAEEQTAREAEAAAKEALKASAIAKLVAGEPLTEEEASLLVL